MKNGQPSRRVLVLGDDTRSFLSAVRSFGRMGLEVHAGWCPLNSPSLKSRYVAQVERLPSWRPNDDGWLRALTASLDHWRYDLVLPCHDSGIVPLCARREELRAYPNIHLPGELAFEIFFDKQRTHTLAEQLDIPVARQVLARGREQAEEAARLFGFPLVVKPTASVGAANPSARRSVVKVRSMEALCSAFDAAASGAEVQIQENFRGIGVGVEVLCLEGRILTAFQHERVHEPLDGGGSSYRRSVPLDPDLLAATRKLMQAASHTGPAMAEFKWNRQTGRWILIEVNGRFWGSLPLTIAAGLDFPRYLYELHCEGRTTFPADYRTGVYSRNWLMDLYWFKSNLEARHGDGDLLTVPLPTVLGEVRHLLAGRETNDLFAWDDPRPAIAEFTAFLGERLRPACLRLPGVRGALRRSALTDARRAAKVLFICYGNICRSPFAERIWNRAAGASSSFSAGYHPVDGRTSPDDAIEAARACGIDLHSHRSRLLQEHDLKEAGCIFVFDRKQMAYLAARYPEALSKTHYLGALDESAGLEIEDPYGLGIERFNRTYAAIANLVRRALTP